MRGLKRIIDLRSDTVTRMSQSMHEALSKAEVGDDVYGDDPSINRFQEEAAKMFGKERGLMTISGTMSNLISIMAYCQRGDSAIMGQGCHVNIYEQGGISSIGNILPMTIPEKSDATLDLSIAKTKILPDDVHFVRTKLILLENTHNSLMGKVIPLSYLSEVSKFAKENSLKIHLDGSRFLNAYYHYKEKDPNLTIKDTTKAYDSLSMCLSKALRCPLGSILVGSDEFITKAHRIRKVIGGNIRQGGYIAAAALQSLKEADEIFTRDHKNAKLLSSELVKAGITCNEPETNIIVFKPDTSVKLKDLIGKLKEKNILVNPRLDGSIRAVVHNDIHEEDIHYAVKSLLTILGKA